MRSRRARRIARTVAALALVALVAVVLLKYVFVVRQVYVEGQGAHSAEEVIRAAKIRIGGSIFRVDEEAMRAGVDATGALCMEEARVRYPSTIYLRVRERTPVAMVLYMGKLHIIDEEGCVIESRSEVPDTDLIYVSGMNLLSATQGAPLRAGGERLEIYREVMGELVAQSAAIYISELNLSEPEDIRLISRTGVTVELGGSGNMENKIAWMRGAVADLQRRGEGGGTLDVSSGTKADYSRPSAAQ